MRAWSPIAILITCWLVPSALHAQDTYEPDQRGNEGQPDELYEPDQRGDVEEEPSYDFEDDGEAEAGAGADSTVQAAPVADRGYALADEASSSFALELRLGAAYTSIDGQGGLGFAAGVFAGARLDALRIGPAFAFTIDPDFTLGTAAIEAQLSFSDAQLEPFARAALGYTFITGLGDLRSAFHAEIGVGLRYHLTPSFAFTTDAAAAALIPEGWQLRLSVGFTLTF